MEPMIILRGYSGPQKLLAKSLLVRSPKRKSIRIFQNVINSIFQQCEKETLAGLAAEEPGCTCRASACPTATTPLRGKDMMSTRGDHLPLTAAKKGTGAGSVCRGSFHAATLTVLRSTALSLMGMFTGSGTQPEGIALLKMSIFSPTKKSFGARMSQA